MKYYPSLHKPASDNEIIKDSMYLKHKNADELYSFKEFYSSGKDTWDFYKKNIKGITVKEFNTLMQGHYIAYRKANSKEMTEDILNFFSGKKSIPPEKTDCKPLKAENKDGKPQGDYNKQIEDNINSIIKDINKIFDNDPLLKDLGINNKNPNDVSELVSLAMTSDPAKDVPLNVLGYDLMMNKVKDDYLLLFASSILPYDIQDKIGKYLVDEGFITKNGYIMWGTKIDPNNPFGKIDPDNPFNKR